MPLQQLVNGPCCQALVRARTEHDIAGTTGKIAYAGHVPNGKIEINAGKVALILVGDLKHSAIISAECTCAQFTCSLGCAIVTVAERIVTALVVHPSINGEHVMQVSVSRVRTRATPPTIWNGVLTVIAVTNTVISAALTTAVGVLRRRISVNNSIPIAIGGLEVSPQLAIGALGVPLDDVMKGCHQRLIAFVFGIVVIGARGCCTSCQAHNCSKQQEHEVTRILFHLVLGMMDY